MAEGASVDVAVQLSETPGRNVPVTIGATPQNGATAGDYSLSANTVTFAANASGTDLIQNITITATDDNQDDEDETIGLSFDLCPTG